MTRGALAVTGALVIASPMLGLAGSIEARAQGPVGGPAAGGTPVGVPGGIPAGAPAGGLAAGMPGDAPGAAAAKARAPVPIDPKWLVGDDQIAAFLSTRTRDPLRIEVPKMSGSSSKPKTVETPVDDGIVIKPRD